jgi:hypothetical protein
MTYWYDWIQKVEIKNVREFKEHYNLVREFVAEISYLIFKGWFKNIEKKNISVLDKLIE